MKRGKKNLQRREHIPRTDAIHADARRRPLNGQAGGELAYSGLGRVVRRLRLRHVDNAAGHAANEDEAAAARAPLHQVPRHRHRRMVRAVDVDAPQLRHALGRVRRRRVVLREAGRRDETVDAPVLLHNVRHHGGNGLGRRHVGIMRRHFWYPFFSRSPVNTKNNFPKER